MSTYNTNAELTASSVFIQYLEELRSGSIGSGLGINRPLGYLSQNADALLASVQAANATWLSGGGTVTYASNQLTLTANMEVHFPDEVNGITKQRVDYTASPISCPAGSVIFIPIDRAVDNQLQTPSSVASMSTYLSTVLGGTDRLDRLPIAIALDSKLYFINGQTLRDGQSFTNGFATDSQYGQQSEVTTIRTNQRENLNLHMVGGGDLTWDSSTGILTWSSDLVLTYPRSAGENKISGPSSVTIASDQIWYATLSRAPSGSLILTTAVASTAGGLPDNDNAYVLAYHHGADNRVYLAEGTALSDGETASLGGARVGVQWSYRNVGTAVQVTDFAAILGANTSYRVGTGELMVYRNGVKAIASKAYWVGTYPTGSLNTTLGAITAFDDYVEEDESGGTGSRIIWLRDDVAGGETLYHAASTHDPPATWPAADDYLDCFVGIQGKAPTVSVPSGIYGFERIWADGTTTLRTIGGYLVSEGEQYNSPAAGMEVTTADMMPSETLSPDAWHYVYMGPGTTTEAELLLSTASPQVLVRPGVHPTYTEYKYYTSVYVSATSTFYPFEKHGSAVSLHRPIDMAAAFASAISGSWETIDLSTYLPDGVNHVRIRLVMTAQAVVTTGDRLTVDTKSTAFAAPGHTLSGIKAGNTNLVEYEFEALLDSSGQFDFQAAAADFQNVANAYLIGYSDGLHTSGGGIL